MSHSTRVVAAVAMLLPIALISRAEPAGPVSAAPRSSLQGVDEDSVDAYIRARMQTAHIPGLALAVVHGDHVAYLKGYGIAGPDGRPVTSQTPFILGSTSKSFTALAVMQLVEAGKIDLDAPVTTYLPWFRTTSNAAASAQITVRNLLHQDSGLPAYEGRRGLSDNDQSSAALEKGVRDLSRVQLSQPAGQRYEYANENYNILGLIVQAVSGTPYEDYIRSEIFAPLQMSHSAAARSDPAVTDIATGYRSWLFWPVAFDAPFPRRATPAGSLISSAEDMTHYLIAQLNGGAYLDNQLLSRQGMVTLHTPGARMGPSSSYGMGWVIQGQPGSTRVWHNGDESNFHSNLLLLPDQHIGIVVLMNVGGFFKSSEINAPIEGVAAILLAHGLTASTNPQSAVISHVMLLAALIVPILWIAWSYRSIRRWRHRGELPPHGISLVWRFCVPLIIDLCPVGVAWVLVPARFHTPMETIALFAPDAFVAIATITALSLGWAMARTFFTLNTRRVMNDAIG